MASSNNSSLRIAQLAPLWAPVPPLSYGGTELIISLLTENLVKRGHRVSLFSTSDSKTSAKLISFWGKSLWRARLSSPHAVINLMFKKLLAVADSYDVIHNHTGFYLCPFAPFIKKLIVSTIHRPITEETLKLFKAYPQINYVAVSNDQKRSAPGLKFKSVIHNAIDVKKYKYNAEPKDYLLWLSKLTPEKGVLEAIEVARIAKERLIIAGNIPTDDGRFFRYEILPRLDNDQIRYVGEVNFERKIRLLQNAKALLFPVLRREPFGLVVIEAQACGTPVIAYPSGAVPELIQDWKTGFLVRTNLEMALAIKRLAKIKRINCRRFIRKYFDVARMVGEYENLYRSLS